MADFPDPLKQGEAVAKNWRAINDLLRTVKRQDTELRRLSSLVRDCILGPNFKEGGGGTGKVTEVTITSVSWDHYVCWNGIEQILVAKPYKLRRSPFIGGPVSYVDEVGRAYTVTYNYTHPARRSATINGTLVEYQVVIPRYVPPTDKIYILEGSIIVDVNGVQTALGHLDLNADARAWARER